MGVFVELPLRRRVTSRSVPCGYVEDGASTRAERMAKRLGYGQS